MEIQKFAIGEVIEMRKVHPCGERCFRVLRVGSDIRLSCIGCGRDLTLPRIKLEKMTKRRIVADTENGD